MNIKDINVKKLAEENGADDITKFVNMLILEKANIAPDALMAIDWVETIYFNLEDILLNFQTELWLTEKD